jgi:hypothetical protein
MYKLLQHNPIAGNSFKVLLPLVVLQQGTQLIAVTNGKNARIWTIRNQ